MCQSIKLQKSLRERTGMQVNILLAAGNFNDLGFKHCQTLWLSDLYNHMLARLKINIDDFRWAGQGVLQTKTALMLPGT